MKSKLLFKLFTLMLVVTLSSCSEKPKEIAKVKPEKTSISGDLSQYIQIVDNEYEIIEDWGGKLSIKVKAIMPLPIEELENNDIELNASMLGENGMPISGTGEFTMHYSSVNKLRSLLKNGSGEEVIQLESRMSDYTAEEHAAKVKLFSVSSTMKQKPEETDIEESNTYNSEIANSNEKTELANNTSNVDDALSSYEDYVDQYIQFLKKAQKGDNSAMAEYPALMEKATEMQEKMDDMKDEFSAKQMGRLMKIQTKLTNAAIEMQ